MSLLVIQEGKIYDSASIVPIIHIDDLTASRQLVANYTNTTGKTMYVNVTVLLNTPLNTDIATLTANINGVTMAATGLYTGVAGHYHYSSLTLTVRPGDVYKFQSNIFGTGSVVLWKWMESY